MKTIVLFPGGFKPIHAGHLELIKRYSKLSEVSIIKLLVGPKDRDGLSQNDAIKIAQYFLKNNLKVSVEASKWPSPVLTAFKEVEFAREPANYILASSTKGKDFERANDFFNKHQKGEKYYKLLTEGVIVKNLLINKFPLIYEGRTDEYNKTPISSSVLRQDIINNDFNNFKTNYPNEELCNISNVWNILQNKIIIKEYARS